MVLFAVAVASLGIIPQSIAQESGNNPVKHYIVTLKQTAGPRLAKESRFDRKLGRHVGGLVMPCQGPEPDDIAREFGLTPIRREARRHDPGTGALVAVQSNEAETFHHALLGFHADLTDQQVTKLKKDPRVKSVGLDGSFELFQQGLFYPEYGLKRLQIPNFPPALFVGTNIGTIDSDIAILDTGVQTAHPDLNVYQSVTFVPGDTDATHDCVGHGTLTAGIAAGKGIYGYVAGIAPGARIWSIKVNVTCSGCSASCGNGNAWSIFIAGLDYVVENAAAIKVANASLGGPAGDAGSFDAVRTAVQNVVAAGVVLVTASGNGAQDVYGPDGIFNSPAGNPDDVIPAAYPESMTVSAMSTDGAVDGKDQIAGFSNYSRNQITNGVDQMYVNSPGNAIDVTAPGVNIISTYPTTLISSGLSIATGTSEAAPHVAGLVMLYTTVNGRAHNAQDVYGIRQFFVNNAQQQSAWHCTLAHGAGNTNGDTENLVFPWHYMKSPVISSGPTVVPFNTFTNYTYILQHASSLNSTAPSSTTTWQNVTNIPGSGGITNVPDVLATNAMEFYRVVATPN